MSTNYYYIREPFTSVRLECGPTHDKITLFESGANCGTLTVRAGNGTKIQMMFADYDNDSTCPMRTHWGGKDIGCVVTENVRGLDPDLCLISEYGEPITVAQIRARAGHVRKDGMPGELFGYDAP